MLTITIPSSDDLWDPVNEEFISIKSQTIQFEHSLISLSKWESKWHKPFLSAKEKTNEELLDYIRCMTLTQNVDPNVYRALPRETLERINGYIDDPMTATTFSDRRKEGSSSAKNEVVTAELIYYWMITYQIPFECQKWHLNRLLTLIRVCSIKNAPEKKVSKSQIYSQNRALNAARRKSMNSKG